MERPFNHGSVFHKIFPLQKYLYEILESMEGQFLEPLSKDQERIVTDHIENALVVGWEQGIKSKKRKR